jgi:DNA polymerase IV
MQRAILYVDPPAFCATVERLVAPALRHRPLAVAPPGAERATVLATSPEAEAAGISRGMAVRLAKKVCPDLVIVPPNPKLYARASRALHELLARWAPVIEPRWYGHAFLDLTGTERLFGPAVEVAARIRREAEERLRLPLWVGVATNKVVSEAATRLGRSDGRTVGWSDGQTVGQGTHRSYPRFGASQRSTAAMSIPFRRAYSRTWSRPMRPTPKYLACRLEK